MQTATSVFYVLMQFRISFRLNSCAKSNPPAPIVPESQHPLNCPFFTVNEALCISMATASAVACSSSSWGFALKWEARGGGERTPGGEDTLSAALQTGKRKHSHVMMEFAPSLSPPALSIALSLLPSARRADNSALGCRTSTRTRTARSEVGEKLRESFFFPPPPPRLPAKQRRRLQHQPRMFPRPGDLFSMGIRCARQTRAHSSLRR